MSQCLMIQLSCDDKEIAFLAKVKLQDAADYLSSPEPLLEVI